MREYEIHVSDVVMFVEANNDDEALSNAKETLNETVWGYGSVEVA
jgi:hypothetical protein